MSSTTQGTVTEHLVRVREGSSDATDKLFDEVYTELRRRAQNQRNRWEGSPTLRTTALAHEAYLKLIRKDEQSWESRSHFFAVASKAMRHILVDRARKKRAEKRGGESPVLSLEELRESLGQPQATAEERSEMLLVLDAALKRFEDHHPRAARVVECRFFGDMTIEETAEAIGMSGSTVSRDWDLAQAWLYREMRRIRRGEADSQGDRGA
jgi:RNA polymerase sigma factor (TIGR02999 family)